MCVRNICLFVKGYLLRKPWVKITILVILQINWLQHPFGLRDGDHRESKRKRRHRFVSRGREGEECVTPTVVVSEGNEDTDPPSFYGREQEWGRRGR